MDFTSLPEKFKVGSDASPFHSELSFLSPLPSWVHSVPLGEADPSRRVSQSLGQTMGTPCQVTVPRPPAYPAAVSQFLGQVLCTWGGGGGTISESVRKHFWSPFCVSPGWTLARRWTGQRGPDLLGHATTHAHLCLPFSKGQLPCALFSLHLAAPWAGSVLKAVSCDLFTAVCGPCYTLAPGGLSELCRPNGKPCPRKVLRG